MRFMHAAFVQLPMKLRLWAVLSTLCWAIGAHMVVAHEVVPTIADITVRQDGTVQLEMRVNVEAQLSGIDLDVVADTDNAQNASDYDALRALGVSEVEARVPTLVTTWNEVPLVVADGTPIAFDLGSVTVPEVPNAELARVSDVLLVGSVPAGTKTLQVAWPEGAGDLILRQQGVDAPFTGLIDGGRNSGPIAVAGGDAASGWQTFGSYIPVGFDHILPKGLDHILFVLGLFFLSTRLGPLLWQVTAFTLAHTVTLALGALGVVNLPGSIVEPLIAASIVYVAIENIFGARSEPLAAHDRVWLWSLARPWIRICAGRIWFA